MRLARHLTWAFTTGDSALLAPRAGDRGAICRSHLQRGQLTLLNQALARTEAEIGLRVAVLREPPRMGVVALGRPRNSSQDCDARPVRAESCAALLAKYGVPLILKLDIEGSEQPCIEALRSSPVRPSSSWR